MTTTTRNEILNNEDQAKLIALLTNGNADEKHAAKEKLLKAYDPLLRSIARKYTRDDVQHCDLLQEARLEAWKSLDKFDANKSGLYSYLTTRIKPVMYQYIEKQTNVTNEAWNSRTKGIHFRYKRLVREYEKLNYAKPDSVAIEKICIWIADDVEMPLHIVRTTVERIESNKQTVYLDAIVSEDNNTSNNEMLADSRATSEAELVAKMDYEVQFKALQNFRNTLRATERKIFDERILSENKATLKDLEKEMDIAAHKISTIERYLLQRVANYVTQEVNKHAKKAVDMFFDMQKVQQLIAETCKHINATIEIKNPEYKQLSLF